MFPENNNQSQTQCTDAYGVMPACAPLAVPYVPFQQNGSKKYNQAEALNNGTLFPGLNLPFKAKVKATDVVNSALAELQALEFVLVELALYLDTHKEDKEAFILFQQYSALEKEGRARYESIYGPLTLGSAADRDSYCWIKDPWPWNYQEGGLK